MKKTLNQFDLVINTSRSLFFNKMKDYGAAWRILRNSSLTDQIFIKATRIRSIQENAHQKIEDSQDSEFIGIINYAIMAIIQLEKGVANEPDLSLEDALKYYDKFIKETIDLMENKNHDYGEAWRKMRVSSITDLILQKLYRIKQIEDNGGKTLVSEGLKANYQDIINYSIFALILLNPNQK
ncbi:MAG: DUF1599 domain-containing protein [Solirubrobacteraceae bacterium]